MAQVHIIVIGFVHGVGFRKFVKHTAKNLGLVGWVRNTKDGSVEAVAVGSKDKLEKLIEKCKKGPFLSQVDNVHVEWEDIGESQPAGAEQFIVRHD